MRLASTNYDTAAEAKVHVDPAISVSLCLRTKSSLPGEGYGYDTIHYGRHRCLTPMKLEIFLDCILQKIGRLGDYCWIVALKRCEMAQGQPHAVTITISDRPCASYSVRKEMLLRCFDKSTSDAEFVWDPEGKS